MFPAATPILVSIAFSVALQARENIAVLGKLQGEWACESFKESDTVVNVAKWKLTIKDDRWIVKLDGQEVYYQCTLSTSKDSKWIDLKHVPPLDDRRLSPSVRYGQVILGIYSLSGDSLTVAMSRSVRPKNFDRKGDDERLMVWKRVNK